MKNLFFAVLSLVIFTGWNSGNLAIAEDIYMFKGDKGEKYYTNIPGHDRVKISMPVFKPEIKRQPYNRNGGSNMLPVSKKTDAYEPIIAQASRIFSVDADLVRAVIKAESNYNDRAVSPKGAQGLMQLMPSTARELGVTDPFDPKENIHGGVRYLSQLFNVLNDDLSLVLAAYNAGPARVMAQRQIPPIQETRQYVDRVLNYYNGFKIKDEK